MTTTQIIRQDNQEQAFSAYIATTLLAQAAADGSSYVKFEHQATKAFYIVSVKGNKLTLVYGKGKRVAMTYKRATWGEARARILKCLYKGYTLVASKSETQLAA